MVNRILTIGKGVAGQAGQVGAQLARQGYGLVQKARNANPPPKPDMDDRTLKSKVETELFRQPDVQKGKLEIEVVDHVVYLRGEAKTPAAVNALEAATRSIPEVRGVENLLHLPKTPSPTRADSPRSQQKQTSKATPKRDSRTTRRRVNAEKTTSAAEPTPKDLAAKGEGRKAAPLGSSDGESTGS